MLKTLLIGALILVLILLFCISIRKILIGIISLLVFIGCLFFTLNYFNLDIKEVTQIVSLYDKVNDLTNSISYDNEKKQFEIQGEEYNFKINKDEESGNFNVSGEAPVGNAEAVGSLLGILNTTGQTLNMADVAGEVTMIKPDGSNLEETVGNSASHLANGLGDLLSNEENLYKLLNDLENSGNKLMIGDLELKVENSKLKINN